MTDGLSLGFALNRVDRDELVRLTDLAESAGIDVVTAADHLGSTAPFQILAAAAVRTERVRLRTYVLDAYFWNGALLAREAATLDVLSNGRAEIGIGTGHMKHEHDDAGIPFPPHAERVGATEGLLEEVRERLSAEHTPRPVQERIPLVVGGWGPRILQVAARQADVIALAGIEQVPGRPPGTFRIVGAGATAERVADLGRWLTQERPEAAAPPLDALLQRIVLGRPPEQAAEEAADEFNAALEPDVPVTAADLLDTPFALFAASAQDAAAELVARRERYGITQWITHTPYADAMAEIARALRG